MNSIVKIKKKKKWKLLLGIILLVLMLMLPPIIPRGSATIGDSALLVGGLISIILLIPYITGIFIKVFEKSFGFMFGNVGLLAAKNLKDNKNMLNNISLLAMGISALLMINTISFSVVKLVADAYRDYKFDIIIYSNMDRNMLRLIQEADGVSKVYGNITASNIQLQNSNNRIDYVMAVDTNFDQFIDMHPVGDSKTLYNELDKGRNILLSNVLKSKLQVKIGDTINLQTKMGIKPYRVAGFCETLWNNGQTALISSRYLKQDMQIKYYNEVYIKTYKNSDVVINNIKNKFRDMNFYITTVSDMARRNADSNTAMFNIFNIFSYMTMIIGIFGILNNYAISFMERKRSLAMMNSVGMSKRQTIKMIIVESLTGGFIGGVIGVFTGILMLVTLPYMLEAIDLPVKIDFSIPMLINSILGGIIVALIASISPAIKSSKLNIIQSLKYE